MSMNGMPLKSGLVVTYSANLCTIYTSMNDVADSTGQS